MAAAKVYKFKTNELSDSKLFDLWKAAEYITMFGSAEHIVYEQERPVYRDPSAPWPARDLGFELHPTHVRFMWNEGNYSHSIKLGNAGIYGREEPRDVIMAALRDIYNVHGLLCAEIMGMVRLYTPAIVGSRGYTQFDNLMGHNLLGVMAGTGIEDEQLRTALEVYDRLIGELLPWGKIENPLAKEMYAEHLAIRNLINKTLDGWRLRNHAGLYSIKTPDGVQFEIAYQLFFHVAASMPGLVFDTKAVLSRI